MRRKHQRRDPLKTVGKIGRAMTGVIEWHRTNVLHFLFVLVVTVNETFVVRIDNVPVARIRHNETAFTATSLEPILPANDSRVGAARNGNVRVVLLCAVNVVGECVVYGYVIKLRRRLIVLSGPVFTAIGGNGCAAITDICDSVWVRWIDPKSVMISVPCRHEIECLSAINRFEKPSV